MTTSDPITQYEANELTAVTTIPADQQPALVYLAGLAPGSRRTMRQALDVMAGILTSGQCDHRTLPWGALRFQHVQAVRAVLMEQYPAATANKMLSALRPGGWAIYRPRSISAWPMSSR
ncbi:MAG TPA: hypothetical protein PKD55_17930 [Bellilinea sp.]|nr:hypothetical protein [Bellilinea sp.]